MNRLIFETTWFNVNWDTWNNTLLIQDLTFFIKTLDSFLETLDIFFFSTRNSEDLLFCSSLNLSNILYMYIKKMDLLILNVQDYSTVFDLHATSLINLSSISYILDEGMSVFLVISPTFEEPSSKRVT